MSRYYRDGDWIMDSNDGSLVYDGLPDRAGDLVCRLLERLDNCENREPRPNRIVVEVDRTGHAGHILQATVRAERPDVTVIFVDKLLSDYIGTYKPRIFGGGGLPIEPLAVVDAAVGAAGRQVEVEFEVNDEAA